MSALTKDVFFEKYRVLFKIGEGGFGAVYKVQELASGAFFALKTVLCHRPDAVAQAYNEIVMPVLANHPAVVQIHSHMVDRKTGVDTEGRLYAVDIVGIIMELADGSLYDEMSRRREKKQVFPRSFVEELLLTFADLGAALQLKQLAHRDFKPENILLTKQGFKLADFGLAKKVNETDRNLETFAGSRLYISPPQRIAFDIEERRRSDDRKHDQKKKDNKNDKKPTKKLRKKPTESEESSSSSSFDDDDDFTLIHDVFKSDVFSLGLIILEAATLCDMLDLNKKEQKHRLEQILGSLWFLGYEAWFVKCLTLMLDFNEDKRPDFLALKALIESDRQLLPDLNKPMTLEQMCRLRTWESEQRGLEKCLPNDQENTEVKTFIIGTRKFSLSRENDVRKKDVDIFDKLLEERMEIRKKRGLRDLHAMETIQKGAPLKEETKEEHYQESSPKLLLEYKVQTSTTGSKAKDRMLNQDIINLGRIIYVGASQDWRLLTAGEECLDLFKPCWNSKDCRPLEHIQKLKFANVKFISVIDFFVDIHKKHLEKARTPQEKQKREQFVVMGSSKGTLLVFSLKNGILEQKHDGPNFHSKPVTALDFLSHDQLLVTGSSDNRIRIINVSLEQDGSLNMTFFREIVGHSHPITSLGCLITGKAESPNTPLEFWVVSSDREGYLMLSNVYTAQKDVFKWNCDWIPCLSVCQSMKEKKGLVFCGSGNKGVSVFEPWGWKNTKEWEYLGNLVNSWVSYIKYDEEREVLVICEGKGRVLLIDKNHKKRVLEFESNASDISGAFLANNPRDPQKVLLIATNFDGRIRCVEMEGFGNKMGWKK